MVAKKIKKVKKVKKEDINIKKLFDEIDEDERLTKLHANEKRKKTIENNKKFPSKATNFIKWKRKETEDWTSIDFFGWYLYNYIKYFEEEDIAYIGKTQGKQVMPELNRIGYFLRTYLDNDKKLLRRFIRFGIKWAAQPESFYTTFGFWHLFGKKLFLLKLFRQHLKGKSAFKRQTIDNDLSTYDAWMNYKGGKDD